MRPNKSTVDYFPHYAKHGKTIFILENKYGNDGYAFWFKLLELLSDSNNHVIDCRNPDQWEYLLAYTKVDDITANNIIQTLINLGKIDVEMWANKILYSDTFIDKIKIVYDRRNTDLVQKQGLCEQLGIKCNQKPQGHGINDDSNTHSKVKGTKVYKRKEKEIKENKNTNSNQTSSDEFNFLKTLFLDYYRKKIGQEYYFTAADAGNLKQFQQKIKYSITLKGREPTLENVTNGFTYLLEHLPKWHQENLSIVNINSKYNEIIAVITKKSSKYNEQQILADVAERFRDDN